MIIILFTLLAFTNAQAGLGEFRELFAQYDNSAQYSYDFSLSKAGGAKEVINNISQVNGLEALAFEKIISQNEIGIFIEKLFKGPYPAPHFCHNIVGEEVDLRAYKSQCRQKTEMLLEALKDDSLEISFYHFEGNNLEDGDFQKAKLHAFDAFSNESVLLNIDVSIQGPTL